MRRRRFRRLFRLPFSHPEITRAELEEEIRFHLNARAEQLMGEGMTSDAAHAEALRRFTRLNADVRPLADSALERERRTRITDAIDALRQDATFALRSLRRNRTFSAAVLLTLAIAIGACTAVFGVTYSVVLRRLPFRDPSRIVALENVNATFTADGVTLRKSVATHPMIDAASLYIVGGSAVVGDVQPVRASVAQATPRFFDVFGVAPMIGRTFAPDEGTPATNAVVVASHRFWTRAFDGDSSIVGREIMISGHRLTVIGVMPPQFDFPHGIELWVPMPDRFGFFSGAHGWETVARLAPDASPSALQSSLNALYADQARQQNRPFDNEVHVVTLQAELAANVKRTLFTLLGAVALVLLVACANIASLWGARGLARARELAIRQALGAGKGRLSRLIIVEAVLLSVGGAALGLGLAALAHRVLVASAPVSMPRAGEIGLHGPVLAFGVAIGLIAGLVCALLPLRRLSDSALSSSILGGTRGKRFRDGWTSGTPLIVAEVAMASLLTVGAGLLIRSYSNAERTSLGWNPRGVITARFDLPRSDSVVAIRDATLSSLLRALEALPGVKRVGATNDIPLDDKMLSGYPVQLLSGTLQPREARLSAPTHATTPGYFATVGMPLLAGRDFDASDRANAQRVYIVNDSLKRRLIGDGDIVGRAVVVYKDTGIVVGVVGDVRQQGPEYPARGQIYKPFAQDAETAVGIVVQGSDADASRLVPAVRQTIARVAPRVASYDLLPMERLTARVLAPRRFVLGLLLSFAGIALALTVIGVYGVVSYAVERRAKELGIRAALGARFGDLLSNVLRRSVVAAGVGVMIALIAVVPLRSTIAHLLFGVSPLDAATLSAVAVMSLLVALVASLVPGLRAARTDAASVLRGEG
jgi:predicted permease